METDYISRQKVERFIENGLNNPDKKKAFGHDAVEILTEVHYMEPADVRPVKEGHWIKHISDLFPADSTIECDQCHAEQPIWIDDNFCPACGADMRGEQHG